MDSDGKSNPTDWAVDKLRTDPFGELDLEQLEYNLSLTVEQRMKKYFKWMEFVEMCREAGRRYYGMDPSAPGSFPINSASAAADGLSADRT